VVDVIFIKIINFFAGRYSCQEGEGGRRSGEVENAVVAYGKRICFEILFVAFFMVYYFCLLLFQC
jgi:hypothetical protein